MKLNRQCKSCSVKEHHRKNPARVSGENNPMFGTSAEEKWAPHEVEMRKQLRSRKMSEARSGSKNPMFGRPAPKGSGRGISGKWDGVYFRSLLELAFLEWFKETYQCMPQTAETINFKTALPNGKNYFPDFAGNGCVYEIKPMRLLKSGTNPLKIQAGIDRWGPNFVVITEQSLNYHDIHERLHLFENLHLNRQAASSRTCRSTR
jgi:hypothetical protein